MQSPERQKPKPVANETDPRASLALRLDRAASDFNPFLVIATIGLLILNLTLYLGTAVQQSGAHALAAPPPAAALHADER
jgi:hypothetical protein